MSPELAAAHSQTVWFDVTDVAEFLKKDASVTGIQRVVSMLVLALDSLDGADTGKPNPIQANDSASRMEMRSRASSEFTLCLYDFKNHIYVSIPRAEFQKTLQNFMAGTSRKAGAWSPTILPKLKFYLKQQVLKLASVVAHSWLRPQIPSAAISLGVRILDRLLDRCNPRLVGEWAPCGFRPGDVFLSFGAFWFRPFYINVIISTCHAYKLRLFLAVYDLIPLRFPAWFSPQYVNMWSRSVELGLRGADCAISISRYGAQDLLTFCRERKISLRRSEVLRLGDEIATGHNVALPAMEWRVTRFRRPGFVLVVSSIDVRKNQELLIGVWERLYRKHGLATPYLILVGKPGTNYSRIMKAMRRAKFVNGRIVILQDVADGELSAFYQHALFTMLPSLTEGWGLPVAESMAQGKLCLASNAASIPEIAGPLAEYFDPRDPDHVYQLVERYTFDAELRSFAEARIKEYYRPTTWAATARYLAAITAT